MKKSLLFVLLLILGISFGSTLFAQVPVEIGNGTQTNATTGAPAPYGTWYKAFRQQFLVRSSELNNAGGGPGNITSLAFNVDVLNNITPMNNFRIRLKHTTQTALTTTFEDGDYQLVFQAGSFTPTVGWNTHNFSAPFNWDGNSNLIVEIVTDMITGNYAQNASVFFSTTTFNSSLRFQSDSSNGDTGTTGTTLMNRSNMKFMMQQLNMQDMTAVEISGSITPSVNSPSNYTVTVKSLCPAAVTNYTVKLMQAPDTVLGTLPGTSINPMQTLDFTFPWTPTTAGPAQIFGRVEMPGDENPGNNDTPMLNIVVQPEGVAAVTIGTGDQDARIPMDFFYKNSIYQCLYYADELGFASGTITAMQLYNNFTTNMPNGAARIWLGSTNQQDLTAGSIPSTEMTLVFDGNLDLTNGTNEVMIPFTTPYMHTPGNLVMMVLRPMDATYYSSMDYFKCQTIGTNRARNNYSDSIVYDPAAPPAGTLSGQFPKATFFYSGQTIQNDLGCLSISGNTTPTAQTSYPYTVRIKNNGTNTQTNYQVKLMKEGDVELASVNGPTINSLATADVVLNWTPTAAGTTFIYGKVVLATDEIPQNNQTANLNIAIQPAGIQATTIGTGTEDARFPMDFYWKNSLYECLYYADELGFVSGTITAMQLYNNFVSSLPSTPARIWLGTTAQQDLSGGYIPSTGMTLVYDGNLNFPPGQNDVMITFSTPYFHTPGNLVMLVQRPMDTSYYSSSDYFKCQTIGTNRARNAYSDSDTYLPETPPTGEATGQFPKTTFFYTGEAIDNDLGCLSITGNTTPNVNSNTPYTVRIKNNGANTQTTYQVKLFQVGGAEIASVNGPTIASLETADVVLNWTPTVTGITSIYAKVVLAGDEIPQNDQTSPIEINVMEEGLLVVQIGIGAAVNSDTGGPAPYGTWYKAFREQYLYKTSEIYAFGGAPGLINSIAFNVQSVGQCTPMTNFQIRMKHTNQEALSGTFEAGDYQVVFQAGTFLPVNGWNVHTLTQPFFWNGGENLIVEAVTDLCAGDYARNALVYFSSPGFNSSLRFQSDSANGSTGTTGTISANRSNIRLYMIVEAMGSMSGTVTSAGAPLAGASINVNGTVFTATSAADGTYTLPFVPTGPQTVTASKHGYADTVHNVTIVEDQNTVQNFVLNLLPQVTVTGRIVGSDQPTVGLADASITLSGYEPYSATTNAQGQFTIQNVFASHTYQYVANAIGYQPATGQAVVGTTNLNMGDISVNEMAFPPFQVVATESTDFTQLNLTWQAPDPNAIEITEGFEDNQFPPEDWSQIINNQNAGGLGTMATWCHIGTIALTPPVPPHSGDWQAGLWWEYDEQDEWLITPQFVCPPNGELTFWSYVFQGSEYNDHYYVKASTDGGNTWNVLWDASTLTGGWNYYDVPITVPLSAYAGQQIKLAFHALSAVADGLYYVWFIDDVRIGSPETVLRFPSSQFTTRSATASNRGFVFNGKPDRPISRELVNNPKAEMPHLNISTPQNTERVMLGYKVWRLLAADQANENNWVSLTPSNITPTSYTDTAWGPLPSGVYKYAVKAVYTNNVLSNAAFSNEIHKGMMGVLTGTVTEFSTNIPIAGATITAGEYSGVSNAQGVYSFSVYAGTYNVTCAKTSYQTATQSGVVIVGLQTTTQSFVLTEITLPAGAVQAEVVGNNVNIVWMEPGTTGGEWIHYDSGENSDSIGTGGAVEFDVAIRFPGSALTDYAGMSLYAVKAWPAQAGTFKIRVWTGGTPSAPAQMVVDQAFTPDLDTYNTVVLSNPVTITADEELWFGYNCNVTSGYPAGCDEGPATDGFGNMMYFQGEWATLLELASSLNYNWNIQGYVGYSAPTDAPRITPISLKSAYPGEHDAEMMNRALTGYKVWRLQQGQEGSEAAWVTLTPNAISATAYQDTQWSTLADGTYKWAVKAVYTGGALAPAAFSNAIPRITQIGTIAGIVRNMQNAPVGGATIRCGTATATTNASGAYSMQVVAGTHSVTASHPNYAPATVNNVVVVTGQTSTVNFQLQDYVIIFEDGFETYENFSIDFAPWTNIDVDGSGTYGITGTTWLNYYDPQAFIIFVPSATSPAITSFEPHGGLKVAACFAAVMPAQGGNGPNDDWLITPLLTGAGEIKFSARSFTVQYGMERFKVGYSPTLNPADFIIISGDTYVQAPDTWTDYAYTLPAGIGPVYIGIHCVSNDAFFLMVDDVTVGAGTDVDDPEIPVVQTRLEANYPNPFNPETTISYSLKEGMPVAIEIYNVKGQLVKTLVKENKAAGNHSIVWNGKDNNNRSVSSGIYYYKMSAGKYSSTRKMILMK